MKGRWGYRPTTRRLYSISGAIQRGNRTLGNPFLTLGMEWCGTCKSEMDCDTEASHRNNVYVFKRWCRRCGNVVKWGSYTAPILSGTQLPAMAFEWCTKPEQDRR
jgi:hypothetical protein